MVYGINGVSFAYSFALRKFDLMGTLQLPKIGSGQCADRLEKRGQ